jgi:hypothetical protein
LIKNWIKTKNNEYRRRCAACGLIENWIKTTNNEYRRRYAQCCEFTASIRNGTVNYGALMTSTSHNRN